MKSLEVSLDRLAKEFRFKLDAALAIIKIGAVDSDTNVISGLVASAEVAALCELILENSGPSERFEALHKESQDCLKLFKEKYKITLISTTPDSHTISVPAPKGSGRVIRQIAPTETFKAKAKERHWLTPQQDAEIYEWLANIDFGGRPQRDVFQEIGDAYGVSASTIEKRFYAQRNSQ